MILKISSRKEVMGEHKSGILSKVVLWVTFIVMAVAAIALLVSIF
jgi:Mn2+/Fe2+ NRAMP family transporter